MTDRSDNPLRPKHTSENLSADPDSIIERYNANLKRKDVIWVRGPTGAPILVDTPEFTARNTRDIAERHEKERQDWKRRNGFVN